MKISNNVVAVLIVLFMITSIYANHIILKEGERQIRTTEISGLVSFGRVTICINHAPYIFPIPLLNATVGVPFIYDVNATDVDNNTLTFGDNEFLFDIDPITGIINFTPGFESIGLHHPTVWVDDGLGCISSRSYKGFYITISPPPRNWSTLTPPEGIFEPPNAALSGTHVNNFIIWFDGLTLADSDVLTCNVKQANGSILPISITGISMQDGSYSMSYTVQNTDPIINDPSAGYIPWILKNCTLKNKKGYAVYDETVNSRIYTHDDVYWEDGEITRAVACQTAPGVYFNNTGHCEFLEDALFALQMRNGNPVNELCFNNPGIACSDPYCNGIYFPTCDPISYFGGYSALSDDPNNIASFTASPYNTQVWYTLYTNSSGNFKVRVRQELNDKTFSIAITNLTNVSANSNVYGGELGGGTLAVADQGDGTWALTHKKLNAGFTGTLDFVFNVSFTDYNLSGNRTVSIIIAYGIDTNAGNPETFEIALNPALGPSNNNESETTPIMTYGPVCADGVNNDFDYLGAGGIWDYSYDCFDNDCDGIAGAAQTNEFGSGKTGLCNYAVERNCTDEYDNDYDYILGTDYTDCHDADCFHNDPACPAVETICNDSINNDWDFTLGELDNQADQKIENNGTKYNATHQANLTDCEDPDCNGLQGGTASQLCSWGYELNCSDNFDNDDLQLKDCELTTLSGTADIVTAAYAEYDCSAYCRATITSSETGALCNDNLDNDWDAVVVTGYYSDQYSANSSHGAGVDCRWGGYFGYGTDYNPDEECNMTILSNTKRCELARELNCSDSFDNDYDHDASGMPHAGWSNNPSGYSSYFGISFANYADYDDYDCKTAAFAPSNESADPTWCFDGVDNDLDRYYWDGSGYTENTSTGYDCYDPDCKGVVHPTNLSLACLYQEYNATHPFFLSLTYPGMYCENALDDDVDGPIDCADPDCNKQFDICSGPCYDTEATIWDSCKDSIDNDYDDSSDGTDCSDSDCIDMIGADSGALCEAAETFCYDGFDNDANGYADCSDSNCINQVGRILNNISFYCKANENTLADCFDGFDNDANGYTDCYDTSCNVQCNLSTIAGNTPLTIPEWYGIKTLSGGITEAYVQNYTKRIRRGDWYNITFRMTSASSRAQWTLGAATGYGQFPKLYFNTSTAYLAGSNAGNFTLTGTANGFIIDSQGTSLPSGYTVSFLIKSNATSSEIDYELTYAENTGSKTSVNNQIYVEIAEENPPEAQLIQVVPYHGNISYGESVYLRANISDDAQLGLCEWYVDGPGANDFDPADSTECRGSFTPTVEGTYYINVTPIDYYSNRGATLSVIYNLNILPSSASVALNKDAFRANETLTFNSSFNVPTDDALGTCRIIIKDAYDNETILSSFAATGNRCYASDIDISSLPNGLYRIFACVTETTESNIIESDTTPLFVCDTTRSGICRLVDLNENGEADVCEANFGPSITSWYPIGNVTITEEQNQTFNVTFTDVNDDSIRVRWFIDGSPIKVHYSNSTEYVSNYTFIADYLSAGERNITAIIDDGEFFASHGWLLNITNVNRFPYFTQILPNQTWDEDTSLTVFDLDDYSYDADTDDNITFSYEYVNVVHSPIRATIDPTTHIVTFSQPGNWFGNDTIYFIIDDGEGGISRSNNITLTVRNVPEPPPPTPGVSEKCKSLWYCRPWSVCYPNGTRYRECIDVKECPFPINIPEMEQTCMYIPTCYDGIKNQGEDDIDCGGPCPPCWTCFDMIQNCHRVEGFVVCEEGIDCGGPCPACPNCFDGIENQDEIGIDCGGVCEADCCENGYRDVGLGEVGVDCGGPCPECLVVMPAPPPISRLRLIISSLLIILLIILLIVLIMKNRERIAEAIYKLRVKEEVVVEKDVRGIMLSKISNLEKVIERKTRGELTKDISNTFRELLRGALKIDYEFTHEELITELGKADMESSLKKIIMSFSEDMAKIKYSGYKFTKDEAKSLLKELKVITHLATKKPEKQGLEQKK